MIRGERSHSVGRNTLRPAPRRSNSRSKTRRDPKAFVRLPPRTKNGSEQLMREWEAAGGKGSPPGIQDTSRNKYAPKDEPLSWKPTQVARWLKEIGMQDSVWKCAATFGVDGATMDHIVNSRNHESLLELGITSAVQRNKVLGRWINRDLTAQEPKRRSNSTTGVVAEQFRKVDRQQQGRTGRTTTPRGVRAPAHRSATPQTSRVAQENVNRSQSSEPPARLQSGEMREVSQPRTRGSVTPRGTSVRQQTRRQALAPTTPKAKPHPRQQPEQSASPSQAPSSATSELSVYDLSDSMDEPHKSQVEPNTDAPTTPRSLLRAKSPHRAPQTPRSESRARLKWADESGVGPLEWEKVSPSHRNNYGSRGPSPAPSPRSQAGSTASQFSPRTLRNRELDNRAMQLKRGEPVETQETGTAQLLQSPGDLLSEDEIMNAFNTARHSSLDLPAGFGMGELQQPSKGELDRALSHKNFNILTADSPNLATKEMLPNKSPRRRSKSPGGTHRVQQMSNSQVRMNQMAREMEDMKKHLSLERQQRIDAELRVNELQLEQRTAVSRVQQSRGRWALAPADANVKPATRVKKSVHNRLYDEAMSPRLTPRGRSKSPRGRLHAQGALREGRAARDPHEVPHYARGTFSRPSPTRSTPRDPTRKWL